jgi:hypothetical protein
MRYKKSESHTRQDHMKKSGNKKEARKIIKLNNWVEATDKGHNRSEPDIVKNPVFWHVTPYGSCKNWRFGRTHRLHNQADRNRRARYNVSRNRSSFFWLLVIANVVSSSPLLVTLSMEATRSYETSVLTKVTHRNIPEDGVLYSQLRGNLKSYIALIGWTL